MKKAMYTVNEVAEKIKNGERLILAGDETSLRRLPAGHWIAGTIPYFMAEKGGEFTKEKIYVTEIPPYVRRLEIHSYGEESIQNVFTHIPDDGFSIIIIPASSPAHLSFAMNAPYYEGFATRPLIGWISGVFLDEIGKVTPKVFLGDKLKVMENGAVVMHMSLPAGKYADINIVNIFKQGGGDTLVFPETGFTAKDVSVNGKTANFADYLQSIQADTRLPLVADYCGAMINISFQGVDAALKTVQFYAPVFKGVSYRLASPVADYVSSFTSQMPKENVDRIFFSCNCILNYLYSELEGKRTGGITGPITFGEIAYQLLNQTMAYLVIGDL